MDKSGDDTKVCATDIKIGARISIAGLVKAAIDFTMSRVNKEAESYENYGASSATGNYGASSATGYKGSAIAGDKESIAVAWGYKGKAKGVIGSYLVLADWDGDENNYWTETKWHLKGAKMVRVDGKDIKEDTFYTLKDGKFVEAD